MIRSHVIVGIDIFFVNDNFVNLMSVIRGRSLNVENPKKFEDFDNGANYRSSQMNLLAARIGTIIHYNHKNSSWKRAAKEISTDFIW